MADERRKDEDMGRSTDEEVTGIASDADEMTDEDEFEDEDDEMDENENEESVEGE
jgi:hypothetical protein